MIINAHCHRNLLDESCIQVAIYDDRLEVTSPGGLYNGLTYEEIMNGHSKLRNKGIANIFSQMGLVEAIDFISIKGKQGKKALYTGALHKFGREDGRAIYQLLKEFLIASSSLRCYNNPKLIFAVNRQYRKGRMP